MREILGILALCMFTLSVLGERTRQKNETAPNQAFYYVTGDFTDTDGDGMTDVAEKKFGYDPNDPISFPIETYFLDENSTKSEVAREHQVLLSDSNRFYYKLKDFHKFGNNDPKASRIA